MPPFHYKGDYVRVICNSCTVKYLSHMALNYPDRKKTTQFFK